jgi:hypothetical protein
MADSEHNDTITIREIEYTIRLMNKERSAHDLYELLRIELTRFEDTRRNVETTANPIRDFLKANIENSIEFFTNTRVYFLNYSEQGSLSVIFTLLLITESPYSESLQAIDYFIKNTICGYFEEILERHVHVSISVYESANNSVISFDRKHRNPGTFNPSYRDFLTIILSTLALLLSLGLGLISMSQRETEPEIKKPNVEFRYQYLDSIIEKKIEQSLEDKKDIIQIRRQAESDSTQDIKSILNQ